MAYGALNSLIELYRIDVILRNNVRHLLFDGYNDTFLEAASKLYPNKVSQTKFGWFFGRNNTSTDGVYRIFTGQGDHLGQTMGLIDTWNEDKVLKKWLFGEKCSSLADTFAGDLQPPFFVRNNHRLLNYFDNIPPEPMPSLRMFFGDMCRAFDLEPEKPVSYKNLSAFRYRASVDQFNYSLEENRCYCSKQK